MINILIGFQCYKFLYNLLLICQPYADHKPLHVSAFDLSFMPPLKESFLHLNLSNLVRAVLQCIKIMKTLLNVPLLSKFDLKCVCCYLLVSLIFKCVFRWLI